MIPPIDFVEDLGRQITAWASPEDPEPAFTKVGCNCPPWSEGRDSLSVYVQDWPLASFTHAMLIVTCYLTFVFVGKSVMSAEGRTPVPLEWAKVRRLRC